jgi:hypothetical protein
VTALSPRQAEIARLRLELEHIDQERWRFFTTEYDRLPDPVYERKRVEVNEWEARVRRRLKQLRPSA